MADSQELSISVMTSSRAKDLRWSLVKEPSLYQRQPTPSTARLLPKSEPLYSQTTKANQQQCDGRAPEADGKSKLYTSSSSNSTDTIIEHFEVQAYVKIHIKTSHPDATRDPNRSSNMHGRELFRSKYLRRNI